MMKLGSYVQCTKISPEFACQGQGQGHRGQKTKKCGIFFRSLGHGPRAALFPGAVLGTVLCQFSASGKTCACCLVAIAVS